MQKAIFFDRDGVLLHPVKISDFIERAAWDLNEYKIFEEAAATLRELSKENRFSIYVITNQPDIGNGRVNYENVEKINNRLKNEIESIKEVVTCPHTESDKCLCRKPGTKMIHDLALKFSISLEESWVVGDRWIDILAGHRSKCQTILIENSKSWHSSGGKKSPKDLKPDYIVKSINEILKIIT